MVKVLQLRYSRMQRRPDKLRANVGFDRDNACGQGTAYLARTFHEVSRHSPRSLRFSRRATSLMRGFWRLVIDSGTERINPRQAKHA